MGLRDELGMNPLPNSRCKTLSVSQAYISVWLMLSCLLAPCYLVPVPCGCRWPGAAVSSAGEGRLTAPGDASQLWLMLQCLCGKETLYSLFKNLFFGDFGEVVPLDQTP